MIVELTDETYYQIKDVDVAVVKVSASWCGPCKLLKPHFIRWSDQYQVYNGQEIKYYEVDGDKCPEFNKVFKIDRYPTTLYFVYGNPVFKQFGMTRVKVFEQLLEKTLELKYERN